MNTEYTIKITFSTWGHPKYVQKSGIDFARHIADAKRWKTIPGLERWLRERPGFDSAWNVEMIMLEVEYKGKTNKIKNIKVVS